MRHCLARGTPFGDTNCQTQTAALPGLESLRQTGQQETQNVPLVIPPRKNPMRTRCTLVAILILTFASHIVAADDKLPREAMILVRVYEKLHDTARNDLRKELQDWRNEVTKLLKTEQRELALADKLEQAIIIRNLVQALEKEENNDATSALNNVKIEELPPGAQEIVLEHASPGSIESQLPVRLAKESQELRNKLTAIQSSFAEKDKLDEALAVRNWIRTNLDSAGGIAAGKMNEDRDTSDRDDAEPSSSSLKFVVRDVTKGANNLQEIQSNLTHVTAGNSLLLFEFANGKIDRIIPKLRSMQSAHSRGGRLDEALRIKQTIDSLSASRDYAKRMGTLRNLTGFPDDARTLVEKTLAEIKVESDAMEEANKQIKAFLATPFEQLAAEALLASDLEKARSAISQMYRNLGKNFPYSWADHYSEPLKVDDAVLRIVEKFQGESANLVAKANREVAPILKTAANELRKSLQQKLDASQVVAVGKTVDFLENPDYQGIRGAIMFQPDPSLSGDLSTLVLNLHQDFHKIYADTREENLDAFVNIEPQLKAILGKQVAAKQWEEAFSTLSVIHSPPKLIEPIAVKQGHWDASVLDVQDGVFLVRDLHKREKWMTRDKFQFDGEPEEPQTSNRDAAPPGVPATTATKLKVGQIVLAKRAWYWEPYQVIEVSLGTIRVAKPERLDWATNVNRSDLRLALPAFEAK